MSSSWVAVQSAPSPRCCCDPWACAALSSKGTQTLASATPRILHTILRLNLTMQRYPRAVALDADAARLFSLVSPDLCAWLQRHVLPCHIDIRNGSPCGKPPLAPSSSPSLQLLLLHSPHASQTHHHPPSSAPFPLPSTPPPHVCHTVSFFHQPSLESEMRALFDSAPEAQTSCSGGDHADSIADVVDACCSGAPCARLIKGAEVKDVKMGDDGAASLSIKHCSHSSSRSPRAISCRLPIASARSSNNSSFPADFFWPPTARPAACARASTPFTQAVPHAGSGAPSIRN